MNMLLYADDIAFLYLALKQPKACNCHKLELCSSSKLCTLPILQWLPTV